MKKILITGLLLVLSLGAMAQARYNSGGGSSKPKEKGFDPQKVVIGGGVGFGMGTGMLRLGVSPLVGYQVAPNFLAGVSLGYQYVRLGDQSSFYNTATGRVESHPYHDHLFSPGLWMRYNLFNSFFVHTQFEYHMGSGRWTGPAQFLGGSGREKVVANYTIPTLLVGAGYRMPIGERFAMYIGVYYDVLNRSSGKVIQASNGQQMQVFSPYGNSIMPIVGFGIGF